MQRPQFLAVILAVLAAWIPAVVHAAIIGAPTLAVKVGDTFTVEISINGAADLTSFQFDLGFAPSIVRADPGGASLGADLNADWSVLSSGAVDNTHGNILGPSAFSVGFSSFTGDGVIADFQFTALSPGVSPLDFSNVVLSLFDTADVANGQITVTGTAQVPEPATLVLLSSGLLLLGVRRLRRPA